MNTYTFRGYPASAEATFTCPSCGKPKRKRTFRHECTVNPFNKNDDGSIRTPQEVSRQSRVKAVAERDAFLRFPLCRACEDALPYAERKVVFANRRAIAAEAE